MRLTIYPRNPILRLTFLVGYFLLSIQAFYVLRPYFLSYAEGIMIRGADFESFTDSFMGITWAGFWVFISFGFIVEILQKKGAGRMNEDIDNFEFWLLRLTVGITGLGMLDLGRAMFENESFFGLIGDSLEGVLLLGAGIAIVSLISILRPIYYKKKLAYQDAAHNVRKRTP
ncbi:hypothetical protein [Pelagicoccus albus]|uniref:Uncharacterized protein n=1 Tax=Pelagicoccus albus TaxID=415222 RepID=A0A7X1E808_9BACT|nr:hypothetical protein [Pelagicoccus albus]MBC2606320.1 hypothetical protein [Pelagicoccus albus]